MSKTDSAKGKKLELKTVIIVSAIIVAALLLIFTVRKFMTEKEKGELIQQEKKNAQDATYEAETLEKQFAKPILTAGDTDSTRRYGYDVLYANHGLRILLKESHIYIDEPKLTFDFINESDTDFAVKIEYCVINGQTFHPFLNTEIPAGQTVTDSTEFNFNKMREIKISKLRLCFKVSNSDYSIYEDSDAIRIEYDKSPNDSWNAPSDAVNVYKSSVYSIDAQPAKYSDSTKGYKAESCIFFKNDTVNDMELYLDSCKLFDKKGKEISDDYYYASFMELAPGNSLANDYLSLNVDSKIDKDSLDELMVIAKLSPRGEVKNKDAETISFRVPLN